MKGRRWLIKRFARGMAASACLFLLLSGCASGAEASFPTAAGRAQLMAVSWTGSAGEQMVQAVSPDGGETFCTVPAETVTAYYRLDGVCAMVTVIPAPPEQASETADPLLAEAYPGLTFTPAQLDGLVYSITVTGGNRAFDVRFCRRAEVADGQITLYGGASLPLGLTRDEVRAHLDSMELDILFAE